MLGAAGNQRTLLSIKLISAAGEFGNRNEAFNKLIDQLYILPKAQGRGCGTALLLLAQNAFGCLHLWTFQRNIRARRFYEAKGFRLVEETDGAKNQEKEPDALYFWTRTEF